MATKTIAWQTGNGNILLSYNGEGDGTIQVSSDANEGPAREQVITVQTIGGAISRDVTIRQAAGVPAIHDFDYTGDVQSVTLPKGTYKIQCWGAQGGSSTGTYAATGSKGGYSEGILTLTQTTTLYVFVGGAGETIASSSTSMATANGGWNGGGGAKPYAFASSRYVYARPGGGATDIALVTSTMSYSNNRTNRSSESLKSRFIVAGGGAGSSYYRYSSTRKASSGTCVGGGTEGGGSFPGTQSAAGDAQAGFGYGASATNQTGLTVSCGGGGSGWYGGGVSYSESANYVDYGGGGSGFVNTAANASYRPSGYTGLELNSGFTTAGSSSFEAVNGGTETGHSGDGHARITRISPNITTPLTFDILGNGAIGWKATNSSLTKTIEYKKNDGEWTSITSTTSGVTISVVSGDVVQFRGDNTAYGNSSYYNCFTATCNFTVRGNVMSLISSADFISLTNFTANYALRGLFYDNTYLQNAENLILPKNTYARCYQAMFRGCTALTKGPDLPAATLANYAYYNLFYGCSSLKYIKCLATDLSATNCTQTWVNGVAATGTFVKASGVTWSTGNNGIPSGWTVQDA